MAKFFVGQRVRVAWVHRAKNSHLVGSEARIIDIKYTDPIIHSLDRAPFERDATCIYGFFAEQLEPILPEGHIPSVYSFGELLVKLREGLVA